MHGRAWRNVFRRKRHIREGAAVAHAKRFRLPSVTFGRAVFELHQRRALIGIHLAEQRGRLGSDGYRGPRVHVWFRGG